MFISNNLCYESGKGLHPYTMMYVGYVWRFSLKAFDRILTLFYLLNCMFRIIKSFLNIIRLCCMELGYYTQCVRRLFKNRKYDSSSEDFKFKTPHTYLELFMVLACCMNLRLPITVLSLEPDAQNAYSCITK